ncbi:MAG: LysR family transcriptional regulator [Myxococcales bacterium]|nr:LysR family transcriptional regulator [Myxococcales bacterium]
MDLNDFSFFAHVVSSGGFAAAARALNEPKSKLSRRVARLEAELGVRLIERSSRRFQVTEVGKAFYERCQNMLEEAELAEAVVSDARGEPHGLVRVACPTGLVEGPFADAALAFAARYPKVSLRVYATNRRIDLIAERIDIAIRVRETLEDDASLVMKPLGKSRRVLVCAPSIAKKLRRTQGIEALKGVPTLTMSETLERDRWDLVGPNGASATLSHQPRICSLDVALLREAAIDGLGIALLPDHLCLPACDAGKLVHVLPAWYAQEGIVHIVFPARRGLLPAVRLFIDDLVAHCGDRLGRTSARSARRP